MEKKDKTSKWAEIGEKGGRQAGGRDGGQAIDDALLKELTVAILHQRKEEETEGRQEKIKQVLLFLAAGTALATTFVLPGMARVFRDFFRPDRSEWDEWRMFNRGYLRRAIKNLERQKIVEIKDGGGYGEVILTEKGKKKILRFGLESLKITKPNHWDGKWRMVFYDVYDIRKNVRERFRGYLKGAGFYPLQKSVYLHAYPCEKEVEFLKYFLGIAGEVRLVIAEKIEDDKEFREYFGV